MDKDRYNLTIKVSSSVYQQLKTDVGKGKMGEFIERLVTKELGGTEKKLEQEYKECYSNPRMLKEAKQWEKAGIES
jgi:predicted CopG family antitoxin